MVCSICSISFWMEKKDCVFFKNVFFSVPHRLSFAVAPSNNCVGMWEWAQQLHLWNKNILFLDEAKLGSVTVLSLCKIITLGSLGWMNRFLSLHLLPWLWLHSKAPQQHRPTDCLSHLAARQTDNCSHHAFVQHWLNTELCVILEFYKLGSSS